MTHMQRPSESIAATVALLAAASGYRTTPTSARVSAEDEPSEFELGALREAYVAIESAEVRQAVLDIVAAIAANHAHDRRAGPAALLA